MCQNEKRGFTLVELVVVIMIIAILGAIAAPRLLGTRKNALDSQSIKALNNVRNAIAMYVAENGGQLPGADGSETTFKSDVGEYLRGPFPRANVGPMASDTAKNNMVGMTNRNGTLNGSSAADTGWKYSYTNGEFIINFDGPTVADPDLNYDDL